MSPTFTSLTSGPTAVTVPPASRFNSPPALAPTSWFVPNSIAVVLQARLRTAAKPWDAEIHRARRRGLFLGVVSVLILLEPNLSMATVVALRNYVRRGVPATWEAAEGTR